MPRLLLVVAVLLLGLIHHANSIGFRFSFRGALVSARVNVSELSDAFWEDIERAFVFDFGTNSPAHLGEFLQQVQIDDAMNVFDNAMSTHSSHALWPAIRRACEEWFSNMCNMRQPSTPRTGGPASTVRNPCAAVGASQSSPMSQCVISLSVAGCNAISILTKMQMPQLLAFDVSPRRRL